MKFIDAVPPKFPDPDEHNPAGWKAYQAYVMTPAIDMLQLHGSVADINRFGARFRVAHSFRGVTLDGYGQTTANGYSALFRLMLVWSTFELFMQLVDIKQKSLTDLLKKHGHVNLQAQIRHHDQGDLLFKFIVARVNDTHKQELSNYFNDDPCNATYLASSIRHIFVHGDLTPNAGGTEPDVTRAVCKTLSDAHMHVMNEEFSDRVDKMLHEIYGH